MEEYLEVNRTYRRKLFTAYIVTLVIVIAGAYFLLPLISLYASTLHIFEKIRLWSTISTLFLLFCFVVAIILMRLGNKVIAAETYPLRSMRQISRVKLKKGPDAIRVGKFLRNLGIICQIVVPISIAALWFKNERFIIKLQEPIILKFTIPAQNPLKK